MFQKLSLVLGALLAVAFCLQAHAHEIICKSNDSSHVLITGDDGKPGRWVPEGYKGLWNVEASEVTLFRAIVGYGRSHSDLTSQEREGLVEEVAQLPNCRDIDDLRQHLGKNKP